jgi:NDP-sugar pyrophosphorylase family protein
MGIDMADGLTIAIMCGGRGRRMGALTEEVPKPLVRFRGETILDLKIQDYLRRGFRDLVLCVGYKSDLIRDAVSRYESDANITYSNAGEEAGILHRLWHARSLWDRDVLMTYGDTFTDLDLADFLDQHRQGDRKATIVSAPIESPFGLVEFDQHRRVTFFREKPVLNYYIGQALVGRDAFAQIDEDVIALPDGRGVVALFERLIEVEGLGVYAHDGLEITFNTQEDLAKMEEKLSRFYTAREDHPER